MSTSYAIHSELRLVVSAGYGCLHWSDVKTCQDRTRTDARFSAQFNQIVDMRLVTSTGELSADETRMLARRFWFSRLSKRAYVASTPAVFGMGRMWQAFVELSDHPSEVHVFWDLTSALEWLGLRACSASQFATCDSITQPEQSTT